MRKVGDVIKVIEVLPDGRRLVEWSNGRRTKLKFEQCSVCKKHRPFNNFVGAVCYTCKGIKIDISPKYRCQKDGRTLRYQSERYAQLRQATPSWVDPKELAAIYKEAKQISAETGIEHQVDHIYPITHTEFCGLHVPWNLRIIPAKKNLSKGNKPPLDYLQQITCS